MSVHPEITTKVREVIEQIAGKERTPRDVGPATPLGDGSWLDSVELVEVLVACEEAFGVVFDDANEIDSGGLETLGALVQLIQAKLAKAGRVP